MIAKVKVNAWDHRERMKANPENYAKLREIIPGIPESPDDWYLSEVIGDLDVILPVLMSLNIEPTVLPCGGGMFVGLHEKITSLETQQKLLRQQILQDGLIAQVHIPNNNLFNVSEVMVEVDACTDSIQDKLDLGWRILCVCPPNAQRRPDYIMGRIRPDGGQ